MADDDTLADAIDAAARAPKKVQEGETSIEQHPLPDQVAADRYLRAREGLRNGGLGIYYKRFVPPGAVGS